MGQLIDFNLLQLPSYLEQQAYLKDNAKSWGNTVNNLYQASQMDKEAENKEKARKILEDASKYYTYGDHAADDWEFDDTVKAIDSEESKLDEEDKAIQDEYTAKAEEELYKNLSNEELSILDNSLSKESLDSIEDKSDKTDIEDVGMGDDYETRKEQAYSKLFKTPEERKEYESVRQYFDPKMTDAQKYERIGALLYPYDSKSSKEWYDRAQQLKAIEANKEEKDAQTPIAKDAYNKYLTASNDLQSEDPAVQADAKARLVDAMADYYGITGKQLKMPAVGGSTKDEIELMYKQVLINKNLAETQQLGSKEMKDAVDYIDTSLDKFATSKKNVIDDLHKIEAAQSAYAAVTNPKSGVDMNTESGLFMLAKLMSQLIEPGLSVTSDEANSYGGRTELSNLYDSGARLLDAIAVKTGLSKEDASNPETMRDALKKVNEADIKVLTGMIDATMKNAKSLREKWIGIGLKEMQDSVNNDINTVYGKTISDTDRKSLLDNMTKKYMAKVGGYIPTQEDAETGYVVPKGRNGNAKGTGTGTGNNPKKDVFTVRDGVKYKKVVSSNGTVNWEIAE